MEANNHDGGSPERTSQMLMQMMSQMSDQLRALRAEREADREEVRMQINALQSAIVTPTQTPHPPPVDTSQAQEEQTSSVDTDRQAKKKKPTLPDPLRFDGSRRKFRAWQLEMEGKLLVDGPVIGGKHEQFAYIYARLDHQPQAMAAAFYTRGGSTGQRDPAEFLQYLDRTYGDPNLAERALSRLETIRQGDRESFASFLPKFERELADSGGVAWSDEVKINALRRAINPELRTSLAHQLNVPKDYLGYVNAVQGLSASLESLRLSTRNGPKARPVSKNPITQDIPRAGPSESPSTTDEQMDWEPTKIGRAGARQGPPKANNRPTQDGRKCFRCNEVGHIAAYCTQGPRARPTGKPEPAGTQERPQHKIKVARVELKRRGPQDQDDEQSSQYETASDDESGNE